MAASTTLHLDWNIQRQDQRLAIAPTVTTPDAIELRYELSTVNQPSRRVRQAGRIALNAGQTRTLTRMAIGPVTDSCPLRLTLWLPDGSEQNFSIDPCLSP